MNRTSKYTLLSLLFAAVFVFGSMAGTDLILQMWEKRRLQESGTVTMESPVLAWQSAETEEEYVKQDGGPFDRDKEEDLTLTEKEIEQVIRYRKNCEGELLHDPVKGQITMEQAFAAASQRLAGDENSKRRTAYADRALLQLLDSSVFQYRYVCVTFC